MDRQIIGINYVLYYTHMEEYYEQQYLFKEN